MRANSAGGKEEALGDLLVGHAGCGHQANLTFLRCQHPCCQVVAVSAALLAAGRLVFILGPEDPEVRLSNATRILRHESDSLHRLYTLASKFKKFIALIPPANVLEPQKRRHRHLESVTKRQSEATILRETAQIVGDLFLASGYDDGKEQPALTEHLLWIFNIYSGLAHGFGWPRLISTQSIPGDFAGDLWNTAATNQIAVDLMEKAHRPPE